MNLAAYRADAEEFVSSLDREYYRHFAGLQDEFDIEAIYERHAELFSRDNVARLREEGSRQLLEFAVQGLMGRATKAEQGELARREAALEIEVNGERMPYRQAAVFQANEPDAERRAAIEAARLDDGAGEIEQRLGEILKRSQALTPAYFVRGRARDSALSEERRPASPWRTLEGLALAPPGVILDVEQRPKKTPRAFCSPVRVPDEVYLVIARRGGLDDYEALFHEAGHAQHFAHMPASLPMEHRYLGDNSITESFAFLFQHLTTSPAWLRARLGVMEPEAVEAQIRAVKLVFLRRYAAKLAYELELHSSPPALDPLREVYARRMTDATHVDWSPASWLSDVDPFFYCACYIRAWALETHVRRLLTERFGELWFEEPEAGEFLKTLWAQGQSMRGDQLLLELTGAELDFSALLDDLSLATRN
jgi:hypothetical protein